MRPLTIVQARMASRRLPGKVVARIGRKTALEHVIHQLALSNGNLGQVVVAATLDEADDAIADVCRLFGIECFRGHPTDVLDRFYKAGALYGGTPIIRVTADCPLLDPKLIQPLLIRIGEGYDYAGVKGAPPGRPCEAFTQEILVAAHRWARDARDREHVITWMLRNGNCGWYHVDYPDQRPVELNTQADLARIRAMVA